MRPYYIHDGLACEPLAPIRGREGVYSIQCMGYDPDDGFVRLRSITLWCTKGVPNSHQDRVYDMPAKERHIGRFILPSLWCVGPVGVLP